MDGAQGPGAAEPEERRLLLALIASLTLCENMGDVAEDVNEALRRLGLGHLDWRDMPELRRALGSMGVRTLYGSEVGGDDDDGEGEGEGEGEG